MKLIDFFLAVSHIACLVVGFSSGWKARGRHEERRAAVPTITFFERPKSRPDDSKI